MVPEGRARGGGAAQFQSGPQADRASGAVASPANVQTALDRFYTYLETINGSGGRERWQRARALIEDLRGMGDVAGQALMQVLAAGNDSDERRAAARLLGQLQVPQARRRNLQPSRSTSGDVQIERTALRRLQPAKRNVRPQARPGLRWKHAQRSGSFCIGQDCYLQTMANKGYNTLKQYIII